MADKGSLWRPTAANPQPVSPLRPEAQPHRVEVDDVPYTETWYCAECGEPTSVMVERLLGGWARVVCKQENKRTVIGLPQQPHKTRGHRPTPKEGM